MTFPNQPGSQGFTIRDIEAAILARTSNCSVYAITQELHENGTPHWHCYLEAGRNQAMFDFADNRFGNLVANFARTKGRPAHGWPKYIFKTFINLLSDTTEADCAAVEATRGQFWLCKRWDGGAYQDYPLYALWRNLSALAIDMIVDANSEEDALRTVQRSMALTNTAFLRHATGILAVFKATHRNTIRCWSETYTPPQVRRALAFRNVPKAEAIRRWVTTATDPTEPRCSVLVVVGPTRIGKTDLLFSLLPAGTSYARENWSVAHFRAATHVVVIDDPSSYYGLTRTPLEGGPLEPPLKSWTARGNWSYKEPHRAATEVPCKAVAIVCNTRPGWLLLDYWRMNCTVVDFPADDIPTWMEPGTPEALDWRQRYPLQALPAGGMAPYVAPR